MIGNTLSYSPDGKLLAAPDKNSQQQPFSIVSISIETGEKTRLTSPPTGSVGDFFPAFSPDQKTLAFVRSLSIAAADIYLLPLHGGEPKRLTTDNTSIRGLSWTSDGREIVFASRRDGSTYNLWKVSTTDATPERLIQVRQNRLLSMGAAPSNEEYVDRQAVTDEVAYARRLCAKFDWVQLDSAVQALARALHANNAELARIGILQIGPACQPTGLTVR